MKPTPLSGFPELLPADRFAELAVLDTLREVFELNGFAPIETRSAEPLENSPARARSTKRSICFVGCTPPTARPMPARSDCTST